MVDDPNGENPEETEEGEEESVEEENLMHEVHVWNDFSLDRKVLDKHPGNTSMWLVTFTDVIALMLTFFVLMYTMAAPEEHEWSKMASALNKEFNKYYSDSPSWQSGMQDTISIDKVDFSRALDLNYLTVLLQESLKDKESAQDIIFLKGTDRLIISMPNDLLFASGSASVLGEGKRTLFIIGEALAKIRNAIEVTGHTDPRPIDAAGYDSNWHLSLSRAANVAAVLENTGYTRPIRIRGMASARYDELPDDMNEQERLALSRRVDIIVLQTSGKQRSGFGGVF